MNWLQLFEGIIGIGQEIIPIFIHNPKSQKIEAVIVTDVNNALTILNRNIQTPSQEVKTT